MMELGNLAIVCAERCDVLLQVYTGSVTVHVGQGPERKTLTSQWQDNEKIKQIIYELNHGKYRKY